ncbi:ATP-dependent RecD-like DNA helicase [Lacrimispora sp. NSJ-141]|uniref:ATP-dependent RecD2 DNA helicase n=1 Tax=Lientehia hominis TaxID=2897778 RepID=A0AAP2RKI5_9FIRM|nr:ATP-dependent RecD-like DNA helicase [Lientehia hominis]
METISGYVNKIVYRNEENGYSVIELFNSGEDKTLVGILPMLGEGEYVEAIGTIKKHPLYGEQLVVESYEIKNPEDTMSIERYLGSGAIKGIGGALAARIVKRFGEDTFRIIEEEPERLAEVKGISSRMALELGSQVAEKRDMRQAMLFLQKYGISLNLAAKIFKEYGSELYTIIEQNPYRLADDIAGVGFKIADDIAVKAGIRADSDYRIKSGILYTLLQAITNGHTYLPMNELLRGTNQLLGVELDSLENHIMDLVMDKRLVVKKEEDVSIVYAAKYYYMEMNVARRLAELDSVWEVEEGEAAETIRRIEEQEKFEMDERQREAVLEAARHGVLVITGGPGTGKTTTITALIRFFEMEGMDVVLGAPTGRAAKRMSEATGYEARTIHRMLELSGIQNESSGEVHFARNQANPLETDVIIIDEMSMVDIQLMQSLLEAVAVGTRLILVGDRDQLPSVGPGNVLKDIIQSESFHVVRLTRIFRQAAASDIILNAHKINKGQPVDVAARSRDFLFIKRTDANSIINASIALICQKLPGYLNVPMHDIQVIAPMRKGALGVERLNKILQEFLNPPDGKKAEKEYAQGIFREGDKVMQIKNNYQMEWEVRSRYGIPVDTGAGVFNGDIGTISEINSFAEELVVEFDEGRVVTYDFSQLEELELAYAITIHKAQGSEYAAVVIPLLSGPRMLMTRNLLYTAVTRARSCVCIVGMPETFLGMIENETEQRRYSSLDKRLEEL